MERVHEILRRCGLNISEAKLYYRILQEKDFIPLGDIIKNLGMTEFTGYRTARILIQKNYLLITKSNGRRYVKAAPLARLAADIGTQSRKLRRLELNILDIEKHLRQYDETQAERANYEAYESKESFTEVYGTIADSKNDELLCVGSMASLWNVTEQDFYSPFERDFIRRRMRNGTRANVLDFELTSFHLLLEDSGQQMRSVRFLRGHYETNEYLIIAKDSAFIFDTHKYRPRAMIIRQPAIIRLLRDYHKTLWSEATQS